MLVVMKRGATQQEIDAVVARIREFGITPVPLPGAERTAIGTFGSTSREAADAVESLPGVAEVVTPGDVDAVARVADCLQIGARNMQNFALLDAVGEQSKPVLLKRGMSATVEELLLSAEYVLAKGNRNVILCERGIRTFEKYTRNTFDVLAIALRGAHDLRAYDADAATREAARRAGLDTVDTLAAVLPADAVVVATPLTDVVATLAALVDRADGAVLVDVASLRAPVNAYA